MIQARKRVQTILCASLSIMILLSAFFLISPSKAEAAAPIFSESTIWAKNEAGLWPYHVYGLEVTTSGTVLAFAEGRIDAADDGAHHLVLKRSTDNGATWGSMQYIEQSTNGESWTNPAPVVDRTTGKIFFFYALNDGSNASTRVFYKSSTDDGVTWSARTEITSMFGSNPYGWTFHMPGPGHGIQLDNGRLLLQLWNRKSISFPVNQRNYGISTIYSDDHGTTWNLGGVIPVSTTYPANESRLVQLDNGNVVMNGRYAVSGTNSRITSLSTDNGATWSNPQFDNAIPAFTAVDASLISFTRKSDGANANRLLFSRPNSTTRQNMTVDISYDDGVSWTYSKVVNSGASYYSDLAVLADNTVLLLYGRDGTHTSFPDKVVAARFNVEWLTNGADTLTEGPFKINKQTLEAESLQIAASSSDETDIYYDAGASGGAVVKYLSDQVGDYISLNVNARDAGTYSVRVRSRTATNRAQVQLKIDGVNQGAVFDPYSSTIGYQENSLGTVTFSSAGTKVFRFEAVGKNASSTGYAMFPDSIILTPQRTFEAERLPVISSSGEEIGTYEDTAASGGSVLKFLPDGVGDQISLKANIGATGTYKVVVHARTATNRAIADVKVNGTSVGSFDSYSSTIGYQDYVLGNVTINTTGDITIRFDVTGKNASSTGYGLFPDSIKLIPQ